MRCYCITEKTQHAACTSGQGRSLVRGDDFEALVRFLAFVLALTLEVHGGCVTFAFALVVHGGFLTFAFALIALSCDVDVGFLTLAFALHRELRALCIALVEALLVRSGPNNDWRLGLMKPLESPLMCHALQVTPVCKFFAYVAKRPNLIAHLPALYAWLRQEKLVLGCPEHVVSHGWLAMCWHSVFGLRNYDEFLGNMWPCLVCRAETKAAPKRCVT